MLKMEDSGIDSDSKSNCNGNHPSDIVFATSIPTDVHNKGEKENAARVSSDAESSQLLKDGGIGENKYGISENSSVSSENSTSPPAKLISTSQLQKRLEKQIQQAKKIRQKEQSNLADSLPKKFLIPRSRLKVPKRNQIPVVTKADSHPLVSWESESDEEFEFHPMSKSAAREITQQLIKDGYNLDLTPDDEDLDLIPPKPLNQRCTCCNISYMCIIQ